MHFICIFNVLALRRQTHKRLIKLNRFDSLREHLALGPELWKIHFTDAFQQSMGLPGEKKTCFLHHFSRSLSRKQKLPKMSPRLQTVPPPSQVLAPPPGDRPRFLFFYSFFQESARQQSSEYLEFGAQNKIWGLTLGHASSPFCPTRM